MMDPHVKHSFIYWNLYGQRVHCLFKTPTLLHEAKSAMHLQDPVDILSIERIWKY